MSLVNKLWKYLYFIFFDRLSKKRELKVTAITVIHTFGRDLKWIPQIHALVTEEALDKTKNGDRVNSFLTST
ncbi:transposase [Evansella sp. AB-rgal1]|uniref:transposase n=1 Tax=Evansella sp. AB-rgal1 TaxID=3242696 RepID=UPI00359F0E6E